MRPLRLLLVFATCASVCWAEDTWQNTAQMTFTAELVALNDTTATFVFTDGGTNNIPLIKLTQESQDKARGKFDLPEIPAVMITTYAQAQRDLIRINNLLADKLLTEKQYNKQLQGILGAFKKFYTDKQLPLDKLPALLKRLQRESPTTPSGD